MKTFKLIAAQGEVYIRRIDAAKIPASAKPFKAENGKYIIGHSETGHHHVLEAKPTTKVLHNERAPDGMMGIFYAILEDPSSLDHLRDHDTHESIKLEAGAYEFRNAREYDAYSALARKSID